MFLHLKLCFTCNQFIKNHPRRMTKSSAIVSLLLANAHAAPQEFQDLREPILNEDCKDLALG